jgi:hypothetical protein
MLAKGQRLGVCGAGRPKTSSRFPEGNAVEKGGTVGLLDAVVVQ